MTSPLLAGLAGLLAVRLALGIAPGPLPEAFAVKMDVADGEQVKAGFKQILEKFGRLDILVNNAAITRDGLAMRMKADDWETVLKTNLTGAHRKTASTC